METKQEYIVTKPMNRPPHPGMVLKDGVIDGLGISIKKTAELLDIDRTTLSRIINGHIAISVEMALRLSKALNTTPNVWLNMQQAYDLWQAKQQHSIDLSRVKCFESAFLNAPA